MFRQPEPEPQQQPKDNLWVAAGNGDIPAVQYYLEKGLNVNTADEFGYTALQAAASYTELDMIRFLLQMGANVHQCDQEGDTPLHYCEKVDAAQFLLQAGADKEAKNREGKTPFASALEDENEALIQFYVSLGCIENDIKCSIETSLEEMKEN